MSIWPQTFLKLWYSIEEAFVPPSHPRTYNGETYMIKMNSPIYGRHGRLYSSSRYLLNIYHEKSYCKKKAFQRWTQRWNIDVRLGISGKNSSLESFRLHGRIVLCLRSLPRCRLNQPGKLFEGVGYIAWFVGSEWEKRDYGDIRRRSIPVGLEHVRCIVRGKN